MKKSFKLFLAAAFLVTEFFVVALPLMITSAKADGHPIQAITHAGFGGGTDVTTRMMLLRARRVLKQDMSCLRTLLALNNIILVVTSVPPPKPACVIACIGWPSALADVIINGRATTKNSVTRKAAAKNSLKLFFIISLFS